MSHDDEEPDSLVQSTFVIPCAAQSYRKGKQRENPAQQDFTVLFPFEHDGRAAQHRKRAYQRCLANLDTIFQRVHASVFSRLTSDLKRGLQCAQDGQHPMAQLLLPFSPSRLKVFALMGISPSSAYTSILRNCISEVYDDETLDWIHLRPRECPDLIATLRILTARVAQRYPDLLGSNDLSDPATLLTLGKDAKVCIFIESLATFHYGVLNDFLQALQSLSEQVDAPTFIFIVVAEQGSDTLEDKLDPITLPLLDIKGLKMPSATYAFEEALVQMFMNGSEEGAIIWPSLSTLDLLRRHYYEGWPDLDQMQADIAVALHHHFTQRPMSALCSIKAESLEDASAFTESFFDRIRFSLLGGGNGIASEALENVQLPLPVQETSDRNSSQQTFLKSLLESNKYLLRNTESFRLAVLHRRASLSTAVRLAHYLRGVTGLRSNVPQDDNQLHVEPRRSRLGGLCFAMMDNVQARSIIQDLRVSARSCSLSTLEDVLEHIQGEGLVSDASLKQEMDRLFVKVSDMALSSDEDDEADEALHDANVRIARVQKRLLLEESSTQLKREVSDWLVDLLRSLCRPPAPLELEAWTTSGNTDYLEGILKPVPRVNILAALSDPTEYFARASTRPLVLDKPDVCRAYQTYQDAGRMINLADWFTAFQLSLETKSKLGKKNDAQKAKTASANLNGKKRRRTVEEENFSDLTEDDQDDDEVHQSPSKHARYRQKGKANKRDEEEADVNSDDTKARKELAIWNRSEMVQARFALAVHELGRMGFVKRTRRKPEHILKLVYDLPPTKISLDQLENDNHDNV